MLGWCVLSLSAMAATPTPVIAVFDIENRGASFEAAALSNLTDYLAARLSENGYQLVPRAEIKTRLREAQAESYRECFDQACQIELGKELAAEKTVSTQILKIADTCQVTSVMYDLRTASTERAATAEAQCDERSLLEAIKTIVTKLSPGGLGVRSEPVAEPAPPPPPPPPPARVEPPTEARLEIAPPELPLGFGITGFAEYFPKLGDVQSVFAGMRVHVGIQRPFYALAHFGYAAAGDAPGDGDHGLMAGVGVEGAFPLAKDTLDLVGRVSIDVTITSFNDEGTLTQFVAVGGALVRLYQIVELGVILGRAPHGDFTVGLTVGVGYVY